MNACIICSCSLGEEALQRSKERRKAFVLEFPRARGEGRRRRKRALRPFGLFQISSKCSRLRADRERTLLVLAQPPHRIERNPFDRDGKGLTEEFCESKAITLRNFFLLFLSAATFTYQVPLFTAGPLWADAVHHRGLESGK